MQTRTARPIATGVGFTEGPVIRPDGEIVFVSIDQGRLYRLHGEKLEVLAELGYSAAEIAELRSENGR